MFFNNFISDLDIFRRLESSDLCLDVTSEILKVTLYYSVFVALDSFSYPQGTQVLLRLYNAYFLFLPPNKIQETIE